ncbi:hypothetical protein BASA61_002819 [Batrachochytrium salamandrivorans]|nr:hypothetical protein BASA60_005902 [Batrachochytrium salamandrivorans]KAH6598744.1 hypothetical protein BASA61_002819 [Batrachochytrium salamandrivorans]
MAGGLYGEIELGKSRGHTAVCPPAFLNPTLFCYVSGNCINAVDTTQIRPLDETCIDGHAASSNSIDPAMSTVHWQLPSIPTRMLVGHICPETHFKVIIADSQITAFAIYPRDGIIAYAETGSTSFKLAKWMEGGGPAVAIGQLEATSKDLGIIALSFSSDGQYLVTLGDLPSYHIAVWDWRAQKLVAKEVNGFPATHISFDPLDSKRICASGKNGNIIFWKLKVGFKKLTLHSTVGLEYQTLPHAAPDLPTDLPASTRTDLQHQNEESPARVFPLNHVWAPGHKVNCSSEDGTEIYEYNTDSGGCDTIVSLRHHRTLPSHKPPTEHEQESQIPAGSLKCIAVNKTGIISGGEDGVLRVLSSDGAQLRAINVTEGSAIVEVVLSPDFKQAIVQSKDTCVYLVDLIHESTVMAVKDDTRHSVGMGTFFLDKKIVSISTNGILRFWDAEKHALISSFHTKTSPSCIGISPVTYLFGVGSSTGQVRIYEADSKGNQPPRLIFRKRVHKDSVKKISFESGGRYMMSAAADGHIFIYDVFEKFDVIGYLTIEGAFNGASWHYEELEDKPLFLRLYVLSLESSLKTTLIYRYEFSTEQNMSRADDSELEIPKSAYQKIIYKMCDNIVDIAILPSHISAGKELLYLMSKQRKLKVVPVASNPITVADKILLGPPSFVYQDHQLSPVQILQSNTREWLLTWSPDGLVTIRSLLEPERIIKVYTHDPHQGGVNTAVFSRDCRTIQTIGCDGILRKFEWKYSAGGRRVALEASENAEILADSHRIYSEEISNIVTGFLESSQVLDMDDNILEDCILEINKMDIDVSVQNNKEIELFQSEIQNKGKMIRERLIRAIEKNDASPLLEQIDRDEFVVDLEERNRLISEADLALNAIRKVQEEKDLRQKVIHSRLKKEVWDSMETIGQSIEPFNVEAATNLFIKVSNYPIRKKDQSKIQLNDKIKRIRRIQMVVENATKKQPVQNENETEEYTKDSEIKKEDTISSKDSALLFDPFELVTNARRRIQSALLGEYIQDIKINFNNRFASIAAQKQEEISKIEEKNKRINSILLQLQLQETIYHPELSNDELPYRLIEVQDSEIKSERFISAEEMKRLEEKKIQDMEWQRQHAGDNSRQRALMAMMGGKLENRAEQDEKIEIVKAEWMNKPTEEMSEEEQKNFKEMEKKMAILKEEQDKCRKALETELRKLQGLITELCETFDSQLRDFYHVKLSTDQEIYQNELRIIKLEKAILSNKDDDLKEIDLQHKMQQLQQEKVIYTNEIPEIKKELEKYREEYESALKRDKEIERLFKKELHGKEDHYETLMRLFKSRDGGTQEREIVNNSVEDEQNPFLCFEKDTGAINTNPIPLNQDVDMPEGISQDMWLKLVEFRNKKIAVEMEVHTSGSKFLSIQTLVQNILEESDRIRTEAEKVATDFSEFIENKFQKSYNLDCLFKLKQGQVEVIQAPMVTDYSDAVLIHRSVVERLNDTIISLGKAKVEALTEMKDYRKGIHSLEWENKMLDLQAENLIIRTRDIQLLKVTKQMQEFIRSGDEHKQTSEITALEKRLDYSQKAHIYTLKEKEKMALKIECQMGSKIRENQNLDRQLQELEHAVDGYRNILRVKLERESTPTTSDPLQTIYTRRRLVDLAKSQAQDITILQEEVQRLRLRTYPAFQT